MASEATITAKATKATTTSKFTISSSSSSSSISPESEPATVQIDNQQYTKSEKQPSSAYVATLNKSVEWLSNLRELNYFPYNSCNSLTIYSYKYWTSQNRLLFATKENNLKEAYFQTLKAELNENSSADSITLDSYQQPMFKVHKLAKLKSTNENDRELFIQMRRF